MGSDAGANTDYDRDMDNVAKKNMGRQKGRRNMQNNMWDNEKLETMKKRYNEADMPEEQVEKMKERIAQAKREKRKIRRIHQIKRTAAAAIALFVLLPNTSEKAAYAMSRLPVVGRLVEVITFRDYHYESERQNAAITIPELAAVEGEAGQKAEEADQIRGNLEKSTQEINGEIQRIIDQIVTEFEEGLKEQDNYQEVVVTYEVLAAREDFFTLKLICYQAAGSGAEQNYFYTIDLRTGKRVTLADLFPEGADYVKVISETIRSQMEVQMEADEDVIYWLDQEEAPEWNFDTITDQTSFYLNQDGDLVICFNEGDVAPMYMGCPEFVIPADVTAGLGYAF